MTEAAARGALALGGGRSLTPSAAALPMVAVAALIATFVVFDVLAVVPQLTEPDASTDLAIIFAAASAAATLPAVIFFTVSAQHEDRVNNVVLGASMLLLATTVFGVADLGALVAPEASVPAFSNLRVWGLLAAWGLATVGLWDLRSGLRCVWAMLVPIVSIGAAVVIGGSGFAMIGWGSLTAGYGIRYVSNRAPRHLWLSLGFFGFFLAAAGSGFGAAGIVRTVASLVLIIGLVGAVERAIVRSERHVSALREATTAAQRRQEERDHTARSALAAIEFTAHALRRGGALEPAALNQLELAMRSELALLRRLVTLPDPRAEPVPYSLGGAIRGVIEAEAAMGLQIRAAIPRAIVVVGNPDVAAELVQNLLQNARKHAPGSEVRISVAAQAPWAILKVDDDGPGIPEERRHEVFKRGRDAGHPTSAHGRGLGLYIAEQLAREQRGHIWIASSATGGASVRIAFPTHQGELEETAKPAVEPIGRVSRWRRRPVQVSD